jgi:hypothetical protein
MARLSSNCRLPSGLCSSACSRRRAATARWSRFWPWFSSMTNRPCSPPSNWRWRPARRRRPIFWKTHILNVLHRLVDGKPIDPPAVKPPNALTLTTEPQANVERYDALRKAPEARHAS